MGCEKSMEITEDEEEPDKIERKPIVVHVLGGILYLIFDFS